MSNINSLNPSVILSFRFLYPTVKQKKKESSSSFVYLFSPPSPLSSSAHRLCLRLNAWTTRPISSLSISLDLYHIDSSLIVIFFVRKYFRRPLPYQSSSPNTFSSLTPSSVNNPKIRCLFGS